MGHDEPQAMAPPKLDGESLATWEKLLSRPARDLPDIRRLLDMEAPAAPEPAER